MPLPFTGYRLSWPRLIDDGPGDGVAGERRLLRREPRPVAVVLAAERLGNPASLQHPDLVGQRHLRRDRWSPAARCPGAG